MNEMETMVEVMAEAAVDGGLDLAEGVLDASEDLVDAVEEAGKTAVELHVDVFNQTDFPKELAVGYGALGAGIAVGGYLLYKGGKWAYKKLTKKVKDIEEVNDDELEFREVE